MQSKVREFAAASVLTPSIATVAGQSNLNTTQVKMHIIAVCVTVLNSDEVVQKLSAEN
jgi:hypothetical protein